MNKERLVRVMDYIKNFAFGKGVRADIYCRSRDTRNGFAHDCVIPALKIKATIHYLNRTWERFDFESVIHSAFDKYLIGSCGLKGKKNAKAYEREYGKLTARLGMWHDKGKIKFRREPAEIFG